VGITWRTTPQTWGNTCRRNDASATARHQGIRDPPTAGQLWDVRPAKLWDVAVGGHGDRPFLLFGWSDDLTTYAHAKFDSNVDRVAAAPANAGKTLPLAAASGALAVVPDVHRRARGSTSRIRCSSNLHPSKCPRVAARLSIRTYVPVRGRICRRKQTIAACGSAHSGLAAPSSLPRRRARQPSPELADQTPQRCAEVLSRSQPRAQVPSEFALSLARRLAGCQTLAGWGSVRRDDDVSRVVPSDSMPDSPGHPDPLPDTESCCEIDHCFLYNSWAAAPRHSTWNPPAVTTPAVGSAAGSCADPGAWPGEVSPGALRGPDSPGVPHVSPCNGSRTEKPPRTPVGAPCLR